MRLHWGQILIAYLIGSFFGIMHLLGFLRGAIQSPAAS